MTELLMDADLFYFAGFVGLRAPPCLDNAMRNGHLLHLLRERVQYNCMGFVGVCGGAMLAGNGNNLGLPGLDLLNGIKVQYDPNVAAAQVTVDTNAERQIVQMTSGCALAFVMDETMQMGINFSCTTNQAQWLQLASTNSEEDQRVIDRKTDEWIPCYYSPHENSRAIYWC